VSASCSARFGTAFETIAGYRSPGYSAVIHSIKSQQKIVNAFSHGFHAYLSGMLFVVVSSSARAGPARILACCCRSAQSQQGAVATRGQGPVRVCVCVCVCVAFLLFSASKSSLLLGRVFWCFNGVDPSKPMRTAMLGGRVVPCLAHTQMGITSATRDQCCQQS